MPINCHIVSAEQDIFTGEVDLLVATAAYGELGIHHGHSPLLTTLVPGPVKLVYGDKEPEFFFISGGYLEVQPSLVTVLADTAVRAADLEESAVIKAKEQAQHKLQERSREIDYNRALAELAEAVARLRTLQRYRRRGRG